MWKKSEQTMPMEGPVEVRWGNGFQWRFWPCIESGTFYWMNDPDAAECEMYAIDGSEWLAEEGE